MYYCSLFANDFKIQGVLHLYDSLNWSVLRDHPKRGCPIHQKGHPEKVHWSRFRYSPITSCFCPPFLRGLWRGACWRPASSTSPRRSCLNLLRIERQLKNFCKHFLPRIVLRQDHPYWATVAFALITLLHWRDIVLLHLQR